MNEARAPERISIFPDPNSPYTPSGIQAAWTITGLSSPRGVWINPNTDEIWIANTNSDSCVRYSSFSSLFAGAPPNLTVPAVASTLGLATDQNGALYVADASNRVAIYYPALQTLNGANFMTDRTLAPGLIASLCAFGSNCASGAAAFGSQTATNNQSPVPTVLGDVQVSFNGTLAPLFYVSPAQINLYVPANAPVSGNANVEVVQKSTGQVLAAGLAPMSSASPGVFMQQYTGSSRQAAVLNQDNSPNSATNPAVRGPQRLLAPLALGDVLDHADHEGRRAGAVESPDHRPNIADAGAHRNLPAGRGRRRSTGLPQSAGRRGNRGKRRIELDSVHRTGSHLRGLVADQRADSHGGNAGCGGHQGCFQ